jgi:Zn-dependent protease
MTARTLEPGEMAAELTRRNGAALSAALEAGEVCARPGGVFGHTLLGTARLVGRILQGLLRPGGAGGVFHGAYGPDRVGEPAPPEHQAVVHHELSCLAAGRRRPGRALLVFVLSLALFVLSIAGRVDALVLPIIVGVLLLHELGHFAAMRAFGYRDTSVFFLPFLGAAAAGSKPEASVGERAIVLLAGPVPGLLLGLWWFHAPVGAVGGTAAVILVAVNLSNLLPVSPLDGGRLVERVFFASSPGGALLFKAASALLFIGTGLFFGVGLVTVIGIVVAAGLPVGLRVARVAAHWDSPNPPADRAALYALVDGAGYAALRFGRKVALVQALEQRFAAPPSSPAARWAWFAVYLALLAAGLYGATGRVRGLRLSGRGHGARRRGRTWTTEDRRIGDDGGRVGRGWLSRLSRASCRLARVGGNCPPAPQPAESRLAASWGPQHLGLYPGYSTQMSCTPTPCLSGPSCCSLRRPIRADPLRGARRPRRPAL